MRRILVLLSIFFTISFITVSECFADTIQAFDFSKKGNKISNKIFREFIAENYTDEIENPLFEVVSYFCDIDDDSIPEIIAIVKSNLFHTIKGYRLFVLKKTGNIWLELKSDVDFDISKEISVEDTEISYYKNSLYEQKAYKAIFKNNELKTKDSIAHKMKNRKADKIQEIVTFTTGSEKNIIGINEFDGATQKNININYNYNNLSDRTKHYLDIK